MLAGAVVSCLCLLAMVVNNETFLVSQKDIDDGHYISAILPRAAIDHGVDATTSLSVATGNSTTSLVATARFASEYEDHVSAFAALTRSPFERYTTEPMIRSLIRPQTVASSSTGYAMLHTEHTHGPGPMPEGTLAKQPWLYSQTGHVIEIIVLFFWGVGVAACVVPAIPAMKASTKALQGIIDAKNLVKNGKQNRAAAELVAKLDRGDQSSLHQLDTTIRSHEELTEYLVALSCIFAELGMLLGAILGALINEYFGFSLAMLCGAMICFGYVAMALYYYTRYYPATIRARSGAKKQS